MGVWRDYNYITRALVWSNDDAVGKCLFLGCDEHLYKYFIESDSFKYVDTVDDGFNIKRLWVNTRDNNCIYGAAWGELSKTSKGIVIKIFKYDGSSLTILETISNVFTGEFSYRVGTNVLSGIGAHSLSSYCIGYTKTHLIIDDVEVGYGMHCMGESISIPFRQYITQRHAESHDDTYIYHKAVNDIYDLQDFFDNSVSLQSYYPKTMDVGYHTAAKFSERTAEADIGSTWDLTYSIGQRGIIEFLPNFGSSGGILYSTINDVGDLTYITGLTQTTSATTLVDTSASFTADCVGCAVSNNSKDSSLKGRVTAFISSSVLHTTADCDWEATDIYKIYYEDVVNDFKIYDIDEDKSFSFGLRNYMPDDQPVQPLCATCASTGNTFYLSLINWNETGQYADRCGVTVITKISDPMTTYKIGSCSGNTGVYLNDDTANFNYGYIGCVVENTTLSTSGNIIGFTDSTLVQTDINWNDGDGYKIYYHNSETIYKRTAAAFSTSNYTPLRMLDNGDKLIISFFSRRGLKSGKLAGIGTHPKTSQNTFDNIKYFSNLPRDLLLSNDNLSKTYLSINGFLYTYHTGGTLTLLGDGSRCVDDEPNLVSNLSSVPYLEINDIDTNNSNRTEEIVFGVSAPGFPNEVQENSLIGKYYLWKYDSYLSDRIDLADFSGMNVSQAISKLAGISYGYFWGFSLDEDGNFFLVSTTGSTSSIDISSDVSENNLISITKSRNTEEIYNYVKATPSTAIIENFNFELHLNSGMSVLEKEESVRDSEIHLNTRNDIAAEFKLYCVKSGLVSGSTVDSCPLFKWKIREREIEAIVTSNASIGEYVIYLGTTFRAGADAYVNRDNKEKIFYIDNAINIGDYVKVFGVSGNILEEQIIKIKDVYDRKIVLEDALSLDVKSGTFVLIVNRLGYADNTSQWSDEGVTTAVFYKSIDNVLYVNSTRHLSEKMVVEVGNNYSIIKSIGKFDSAFMGFKLELTGSTLGTITKGQDVSAYYTPFEYNDSPTYHDLYNNKISIKVDVGDRTAYFYEGNYVIIRNAGLELKEAQTLSKIAQDFDSISAFGRQEKTVSNRFLNKGLAVHYANTLLNAHKSGFYILKINMPFEPSLKFVDSNKIITINVYNHVLFKTCHYVTGYPISITHNLSSGTSILEVRINAFY